MRSNLPRKHAHTETNAKNIPSSPASGTTRSEKKAKSKKKRRKNKRTHLRAVPTTPKEFANLLTSFGFEVSDSYRTHRAITHPRFPGTKVSFPVSPFDRRWAMNSVSQIRHVFGIDLRRDDPATWAD